jgi:hypothetical protein
MGQLPSDLVKMTIGTLVVGPDIRARTIVKQQKHQS